MLFRSVSQSRYSPLVTSNRYTGERFILVAQGKKSVEEVFYYRPPGIYRDRDGNKFEYSEIERAEDIEVTRMLCRRYKDKTDRGCPYEMARGRLDYDFRQDFCLSGTIKDVFHWMDQRSKADSQLEVQTLTAMAFDVLKDYSPELFAWYKENRYGRALLAP